MYANNKSCRIKETFMSKYINARSLPAFNHPHLFLFYKSRMPDKIAGVPFSRHLSNEKCKQQSEKKNVKKKKQKSNISKVSNSKTYLSNFMTFHII